MWAVRLHRYLDRPRVEELDEPGIERPYDVLVDIGGAGLCRTDFHIAEGQWADRSGVTLPHTLGHEDAGWVPDGQGAEVVLDFVGGQGAEMDSWRMTKRAGSHYVIGHGGMINVAPIDVISTERNVIGNLVGCYNELAELMALVASDRVHLLTHTYPLDAVNDAMDGLVNGRLRGRGILVTERLS